MKTTDIATENGHTFDSHLILTDPGKFEAESVDILYWYDHALNGGGELLGDPEAETLDGEYFEITDEDRAACVHIEAKDRYAILWYSDQGFVSLEYSETEPS